MKYNVAAISHIGNVRQVNQDAVLARTARDGNGTVLLAVADGMGGLSCGEKASAIAVATLDRWWKKRKECMTSEEVSASLDAAIFEAHRQIYYLSEQIGQPTGSTLSLLWINGKEAVVKQIGDSRVYRVNSSGLWQITEDQTWCGQMIRAGKLTEEQARYHHLRHALVNALGMSSELEISSRSLCVERGDIFLICSDGFYNELTPQTMAAIVRKEYPKDALNSMLRVILEGRAGDNASAVLCRVT